jgi:hypothetical protein
MNQWQKMALRITVIRRTNLGEVKEEGFQRITFRNNASSSSSPLCPSFFLVSFPSF